MTPLACTIKRKNTPSRVFSRQTQGAVTVFSLFLRKAVLSPVDQASLPPSLLPSLLSSLPPGCPFYRTWPHSPCEQQWELQSAYTENIV